MNGKKERMVERRELLSAVTCYCLLVSFPKCRTSASATSISRHWVTSPVHFHEPHVGS